MSQINFNKFIKIDNGQLNSIPTIFSLHISCYSTGHLHIELK